MNLNIGKNIKSLRTQRGITQETLANRIGVAPQSVSKWERGEGYPDITFLMPLAEYFGVSLDTLMGIDMEKTEQHISEKIREIEHLRHLGKHEEKNAIIRELYAEHPFDFRVIAHYVDLLCKTPCENHETIESLCQYVLDECNIDAVRYDIIASAIEMYSGIDEYEKAEAYISRLPKLWNSQEFAHCQIYPAGDKRDNQAMAAFLDAAMERVIWMMYCTAVNRNDFTTEEQIGILERTWAVADAVYPDFDCDVCHSGLADVGFALFRRYTMLGQQDKALDALERAFRHEKAIDECDNDVVVHTSLPLRGGTFDMRETWSGAECNGVYFLLERVEKEELSAKYADDGRFQELLKKYSPFAKENGSAE